MIELLKINGSTSVIVGSSSDPKYLQVFGTQSISDLLTTSAGISMIPLVSPSLMELSNQVPHLDLTITAGAGMTLDGSTLGIDPTAIVHVAGISADGGATFDGIVYANDSWVTAI